PALLQAYCVTLGKSLSLYKLSSPQQTTPQLALKPLFQCDKAVNSDWHNRSEADLISGIL
uniref:Uncharacterized protein n=1 Tax=Chrysemys picta bellii TaxID=8478 RepID=A0A8C3IXZ4_CHRPI